MTKLILAIFSLTILSSLHANELKVQTVVAEGIGSDVQSAARNAAQNALTNVVGSFIDATTIIEKRSQIIDGIKQQSSSVSTNMKEYSQGSIKAFEVIESVKENGLHKITAKVSVRIEDFKAYIKNLAQADALIDESLFGQIAAEEAQLKDLAAIFSEITRPLYAGDVLKFELSKVFKLSEIENDIAAKKILQTDTDSTRQMLGKAFAMSPDQRNNPNAVYVKLKITVNEDYKKKFLQSLENIGVEKKEIRRSYSYESVEELEIEGFKLNLENKSQIMISQGNRLIRYVVNTPTNGAYGKDPEKFIGCAHEQAGNYFWRKIGKTLILEFLNENSDTLATLSDGFHSGDNGDDMSNKNIFYSMYDYALYDGLTNYTKPWIPIKCIGGAYRTAFSPIFYLDPITLYMFFNISDEIKSAKKMNAKLME